MHPAGSDLPHLRSRSSGATARPKSLGLIASYFLYDDQPVGSASFHVPKDLSKPGLMVYRLKNEYPEHDRSKEFTFAKAASQAGWQRPHWIVIPRAKAALSWSRRHLFSPSATAHDSVVRSQHQPSEVRPLAAATRLRPSSPVTGPKAHGSS